MMTFADHGSGLAYPEDCVCVSACDICVLNGLRWLLVITENSYFVC